MGEQCQPERLHHPTAVPPGLGKGRGDSCACLRSSDAAAPVSPSHDEANQTATFSTPDHAGTQWRACESSWASRPRRPPACWLTLASLEQPPSLSPSTATSKSSQRATQRANRGGERERIRHTCIDHRAARSVARARTSLRGPRARSRAAPCTHAGAEVQ